MAQLGSGLRRAGEGGGGKRSRSSRRIYPGCAESRARGTKVKSAGFPSGELDRTGSPAGGRMDGRREGGGGAGGGRTVTAEEEEDARGDG